ncbi:MAG: hypothetical protein JNK67_01400 [Alphaproteobacteria bacterium]|nr:hypothetical protein [Alphaproteobacteria bacterium]
MQQGRPSVGGPKVQGGHSMSGCFMKSAALGALAMPGLLAAQAGAIAIGDVQGAGHLSPLLGTTVEDVEGIVTRTITTGGARGFYMQDPRIGGDGDTSTSDGIFVFTGAASPGVAVGDRVRVGGAVQEFRAGCTPSCAPTDAAYSNLTVTQIQSTPATIARLSSGNALPAAAIIGADGRLPPNDIGTNSPGSAGIETPGYVFRPGINAVDFYESLEGMRVLVKNAVAVGPTNGFGEIPVLADGGAAAALRTSRGGVAVAPGSFNGDRIILDDRFVGAPAMPKVKVGDGLGDVIGLIDYNFANYKLQLTEVPGVIGGGLAKEVAAPAKPGQLAIASFNVENLAGNSSAAKFAGIAGQIVGNLRSPDIIGLSEIQDANGATDNGVVGAAATFARLIAAIEAAGGPRYDFRQIDPQDNADGGAPGANIRVGFLFNPATVRFVDKPGGDAITATGVGPDGSPTLSPGRIDPADPAWSAQPPAPGEAFSFDGARKPLVGEFEIAGRRIHVVVNHLKSKSQDQPLFGRFQDPAEITAAQRVAQARVVAEFVAAMLAADRDAPIVLLGDYNDFQFSAAIAELIAAGIQDLYDLVPESERYSYVFDGNSQALDHILASPSMARIVANFDVVHMNSEFLASDRFSDHDAVLAVFDVAVPAPATALLLLPALATIAPARRRRAAQCIARQASGDAGLARRSDATGGAGP